MARAFGVDTELNISVPRGGGGGAGSVRPSATSKKAGAWENLARNIGTLATEFSEKAKDYELGGFAHKILTGVGTRSNVEAQIYISRKINEIAKSHGLVAAREVAAFVKNPVITFMKDGEPYSQNISTGETTKIDTGQPGTVAETEEQLVQLEMLEQNTRFNAEAPLLSSQLSLVLERAGNAGKASSVSAHDLHTIPNEFLNFVDRNLAAAQGSSVNAIDVNRDVRQNIANARKLRLSNDVLNSIDKVVFAIAESDTLERLVKEKVIDITEIQDIFDKTKADIMQDLTSQRTLGRLGIDRGKFITNLNSQITAAMKSYQAIKDGKYNALLDRGKMIKAEVDLKNWMVQNNFSDVVREGILKAPYTSILVAQAVALTKTQEVIRAQAGRVEDFNIVATIRTNATDLAGNFDAVARIDSESGDIGPSKLTKVQTNLTRLTKVLDSHPVLVKQVAEAANKYTKLIEGLDRTKPSRDTTILDTQTQSLTRALRTANAVIEERARVAGVTPEKYITNLLHAYHVLFPQGN